MTDSDEGCCCVFISVIGILVTSAIIVYWYIVLPIFATIFIIYCLYLYFNNKTKKTPLKKGLITRPSNKKEINKIDKKEEKKVKVKYYHFGERLHPDEWYKHLYKESSEDRWATHKSRSKYSINPQYYKDVGYKDVEELHNCPYCHTELSNSNCCKYCGWIKKEKIKEKEKRSRRIPIAVQREVWRRDEGRCVDCGTKEKLEYDHIIPFSKGGSNTVRNIQLLCESCNRKKTNNI